MSMTINNKSVLPIVQIPHLLVAVLTTVLALTTGLTLGACAPRQPVEVAEADSAPPPSTDVYFYPKQGQSEAQQDRDRYECHLWAVKKTGFDPSDPSLAPHQRVRVVPAAPAGRDTAVGVVTGAAIGAAVARPGRKGGGAVVGAVAGGMLGAASDASRREKARRLQEQYDREHAAKTARYERQAANYRRAMAACLEGRGYSVHE